MLARLVTTALIVYTILLGATYTGVLVPQFRLFNVALLGGVLLLWAWRRRRWSWHPTPLDAAIVLWLVAFVVSLVANPGVARRILTGIWFMGLYIIIWYILNDALANGGIRRGWLVDALLIAGIPVVFVSFAQVQVALMNGLAIPRPVGTLGNPNSLASFLLMLFPFAAGRLFAVRSPLARVALALYTVAILALIALSFSRGGWVGAAVAVGVWVALHFPLRRLWANASSGVRAAAVLSVAAVVLVGAYVIIRSLGISGRGLGLRTWLYDTALTLISEQPLTGHGLFTFGAGLSRLNSLPPLEPHSHAHNIVLHVAAELGIVGVAALALTAWLILRRFWRVRDSVSIMGIAAFAGFATHQMLDITAMMPSIALFALFVLIIGCSEPPLLTGFAPPANPPRNVGSGTSLLNRRRISARLVGSGGLLLVGFGFFSAITYYGYVDALSEGIATGRYSEAAAAIQPAAQTDPSLALYPQQQGLLLALAAAQGEPTAPQSAEKFAQVAALEPDYAANWANLAAMQAETGSLEGAIANMRRATDLAPSSWSLAYRYAVYLENHGETDAATDAYERAIAVTRDIPLLPEWEQSPLRRALTPDEAAYSPLAQTILLLQRGDVAAAQALWSSYPARASDVSGYHVLSSWLALVEGNRALAAAKLDDAQRLAYNRNARAWVELGAAMLNEAEFDQHVAAARTFVTGTPTQSDWEFGENVAYIQYLSLAMPRQFVPQVGYSEIDPALTYLLSGDTLDAVRATVIG